MSNCSRKKFHLHQFVPQSSKPKNKSKAANSHAAFRTEQSVLVSRKGDQSIHIVKQDEKPAFDERPPTAIELADWWKAEDIDVPNFYFEDDATPACEDDDDPDVKPQEYHNYLSERNEAFSRKGFKDGQNILEKIDHVDPELVGGFKVEKLYEALKKTPLAFCNKRGVRMILNYDSNNMHGVEIETPEEQRKKALKKGINPDVSKPPTSMVAAAIRKLASKSRLFEPIHQHSRFTQYVSTAGAFFVIKSNGLLRVIIDGRLANTHFKASNGKFSLFTIETVRQVIDNLSVDPITKQKVTWYALNFDLRHWFHQLPLPARLRRFFGIEMTDRDNRGKQEKFYMHPRMVPMGFTLAPYIAQRCTWSLLLASEEAKIGAESGLGPQLQRLPGLKEPPSWVPLKDGGGIFVLLDNVLIVTPVEDVADFWFERFFKNCDDFNAILKYESDTPLKGKELKDALDSQCYHRMTPSSDNSFNFYGVEWRHHHHRVPIKDPSPQLPDYKPRTRYFHTRRKLASVLGKLLWHRRIHRKKYYDGTDESKAIMKLYQRYTPREHSEWNKPFRIELDEEIGLMRAWESRHDQEWLPAQPLSCGMWNPSEIEWIATDAATESNLAAAVFLSRHSGGDLPVITHHYPPHYKIAVAELYAIYLGVKTVMSQKTPPKLIVLATDSQNAKNWIEKGHAKNQHAMELLREIDLLLDRSVEKTRLYLVYINTDDNVADQPSRGEQIERPRLTETVKILTNANESAKGLWRVSGDKVGGVSHLETEDGRRDREG